MAFIFGALLLTAILLMAADPLRSSTRWLSMTAFCGALGAFAGLIDFQIYPYIDQTYPQYSGLLPILYGMQASSSLTSYYGVPYAFLMFAIRYRDLKPPGMWEKALPMILLLPIALTLLFTPGYTENYPISFPVVSAWAIPYIAAGMALVLSRKEINRISRRGHIILCMAVLPPMLLFTVLNYVLQSLGYIGVWRYNLWMVAVGFAIFIVSIFRYGFLGVQFLVQTRRLDSTLRAVTSGTAILNHAIKNDVGKMRLFGEKIRSYAKETGQQELGEDIDVMLKSAKHIQEMVLRVHEQTQEIPIKLQTVRMRKLCEDVLASLKPALKDIKVSLDAPDALTAVCDRAQSVEVLTNVVRNAIEAMPRGGDLSVRAYETKRTVAIEVKDTGPGISPKDLKKVLEPFYTTKAGSAMNFGLGLAYCYNVMRKHGGALDINSNVGQGTTVSLSFPKRLPPRRKGNDD